MTESDVRNTLAAWESLRKCAVEIGRELFRQWGWFAHRIPDDATFEVEGETAVVCWCDRENDRVDFPLAYLWLPDWADRERERIESQKRAQAEMERRKQAERDRREAERDESEYKRLWDKYKGRQP